MGRSPIPEQRWHSDSGRQNAECKKKGYYDDNGSLTEKGRQRRKAQEISDSEWWRRSVADNLDDALSSDVYDKYGKYYADPGGGLLYPHFDEAGLSGLRDYMKQKLGDLRAPSGRVVEFVTDRNGELFVGLVDEYVSEAEKRKQLVVSNVGG